MREELGHKLIRCPERVVRPEARETKNEKPYYLGKIRVVTNIFQMGWNHQLDFIFPLVANLTSLPLDPPITCSTSVLGLDHHEKNS